MASGVGIFLGKRAETRCHRQLLHRSGRAVMFVPVQHPEARQGRPTSCATAAAIAGSDPRLPRPWPLSRPAPSVPTTHQNPSICRHRPQPVGGHLLAAPAAVTSRVDRRRPCWPSLYRPAAGTGGPRAVRLSTANLWWPAPEASPATWAATRRHSCSPPCPLASTPGFAAAHRRPSTAAPGACWSTTCCPRTC